MKILISACLCGKNCKYSGGNNYSREIEAFLRGHEVAEVCPEVMGGLPVPRKPAEIKDGRVMTKDGDDYTEAYMKGAELTLKRAREFQPDLCILQSRSPSCGAGKIYDGSFEGKTVDGMGVTAKLLSLNGFRIKDSEELIGEEKAKREKSKAGRSKKPESSAEDKFRDYLDTPVGLLEIRACDEGITYVGLEKNRVRHEVRRSENTDLAKKELSEYFAGTRRSFTVPLSLHGTEFQLRCWSELLKTGYGETISYSELSEKVTGNRRSCRAVGGANHRNPVMIIVPCHRVVGADKSLVGYAGGLEMKEKLLKLEGAI